MTAAPKSGTLSITMPSDLEVLVTRDFLAPRRLVFEAHTSCAHIPNWMGGFEGWTMHVCEHDLRAGGSYRMGWRKESGEEMYITGSYREVTPPERFVSTESWGAEWPEMVNTFVFSEKDGRTTLSLTIAYSSKEARDTALQSGMTEGMTLSYERLDQFLSTLA